MRLFQTAQFEQAKLQQQGSGTQASLRGWKQGLMWGQILVLSGWGPMALLLVQPKSQQWAPPGYGAQRLGLSSGWNPRYSADFFFLPFPLGV